MKSLNAGDTLPNLTVTTHRGDTISLSDFRDQSALVLFFYPKSGSPICTKEACAFRDAYEGFVEAGATVIGISGDAGRNQQQFASQHHLPFLLATDTDGQIRRVLGVPKSLGIFPGRVTYVVDKRGVIRHIFNSQLDAERHVKEALAILREIE